jgi:hypothetical protein
MSQLINDEQPAATAAEAETSKLMTQLSQAALS